ncbi:fused MFS/spermidine synthase [Stakelama tenebrarum]|uniref:Spermidine synthase n=1 Tax=Stakelama tenebrarum TaxID=2711215 RepID=A0A6G6Y6T8_9SPHN|nr:fused MFS/spermidine synthase [Sphingosinithalassobacter tenebrarum]QIG80630.1 hypothetical protein G5C33_13120 [Sphingosinithalassobacter tenebrarum]
MVSASEAQPQRLHPHAGWLFVVAILTGAFLLFLVQPMVARMALPRLGGAPAVWNSAMLVYQALLLGGYAYAHWLGRFQPRLQAGIHLGVLALCGLWLPIGLMAMQLPARVEPALWVPWLFGASIGPLFFAVSAQAPLIQRWFNAATGGRDPYALYAASNVGSFAGLIAYPLLVEPQLALHGQSLLWSAGYILVFLLVAACALLLPRGGSVRARVAPQSEAPRARRVLHWVALAFVPSGLMLATTTFLTTDIVAVPLLWVLPLGLYLLSFVVAFATHRLAANLASYFTPAMLLLFGATLISGNQEYSYLNAAIGLTLLFFIAVTLHARMYVLRPEPDRLTGFYLAMSIGGALGGVFAGLIAPVLFDWTYEYPLLILAAALLVPQQILFGFLRHFWKGGRRAEWLKSSAIILLAGLFLWLGLAGAGESYSDRSANIAFLGIATLGLISIGRRVPFFVALTAGLVALGGYHAIQLSLAGDRTRSYFGVYTVTDYPEERHLAHGTTLHGVQLKGDKATQPTTYYVRDSGVGQAMRMAPFLYGPAARIGVVGLGTGTLACYARPGEQWHFFEIDPVMVRLARDSGDFSFLSRCIPGEPAIAIGDARMRLNEMADDSFDLLALDAFSSDAVPMHLMTVEAFETYGRVLDDRGLLLVHISNRFLALSPVVAAAAERTGWHAARMVYYPPAAERADQATVSDWIALSRDKDVLDALRVAGDGWQPLAARPGISAWTDDHASIVPLLRAFHPELADD